MDVFASLQARPDLFERLDRAITLERAAEWFVRIADTYAPSQTARHTRGRVMHEILKESGALDSTHHTVWLGDVDALVGRKQDGYRATCQPEPESTTAAPLLVSS